MALQLLTIAEAAEALGINGQAIYRRVWSGELKAVNIGSGTRSRLRIRVSDLEAYAAEREVKIPARRKRPAA